MNRSGLRAVGALTTAGSDRFADAIGGRPAGRWRPPAVGSVLHHPVGSRSTTETAHRRDHHHHRHHHYRFAPTIGFRLALSVAVDDQDRAGSSARGPAWRPRSTNLIMVHGTGPAVATGAGASPIGAAQPALRSWQQPIPAPIPRTIVGAGPGPVVGRTEPDHGSNPDHAVAAPATIVNSVAASPRPVERVVSGAGTAGPPPPSAPAAIGTAAATSAPAGLGRLQPDQTTTVVTSQLVREVAEQVNRQLDRRVRNQRARLGRF